VGNFYKKLSVSFFKTISHDYGDKIGLLNCSFIKVTGFDAWSPLAKRRAGSPLVCCF